MSVLYWIILIVGFLFGGFGFFTVPVANRNWTFGGFGFVIFILFVIIGIAHFPLSFMR